MKIRIEGVADAFWRGFFQGLVTGFLIGSPFLIGFCIWELAQ